MDQIIVFLTHSFTIQIMFCGISHSKRLKISELGVCQKLSYSNTFCLLGLDDPTHQTNILSRSGHNLLFLGPINSVLSMAALMFLIPQFSSAVFPQGTDKTYVLIYNSCIALKVTQYFFKIFFSDTSDLFHSDMPNLYPVTWTRCHNT